MRGQRAVADVWAGADPSKRLGGIVGEGCSVRLEGLERISQPSSFPHSPLPSDCTALIRLIRTQYDDKRAFAFYGHRYFQASTLSSNNAGAWINTAHLSVASGLSPTVDVFNVQTGLVLGHNATALRHLPMKGLVRRVEETEDCRMWMNE